MPHRTQGWRRVTGAVAVMLGVCAAQLPGNASSARADPSSAPQTVGVSVRVASTPGAVAPLPAGFLGLSVEFSALHAYLGRDPLAPNPVFLALLSGIDQGHPPVLRVGGNSTDETWWPLPGVVPPPGVTYTLTPDWLAGVRALVRRTDARLILGVNLAADDPQLGAVMARGLVNGIGARHIEALEIGNEPDLYQVNPWYHLPSGETINRRGRYSYADYTVDLAHWSAVVPGLPLAGGALASLSWLPRLSRVAGGFPRVSTVSAHRYALTNCGVPPTSPLYPTIPNLLAPAATSGPGASLAPAARTLHAEGLNLRVDELNSASCEGAPGVSDAFASALWVIDALFGLAQAGVDGVNIHTLPGSRYAPFSFTETAGRWQGTVAPLYYGLLFFARAFPAGAHLLNVQDSSAAGGGRVKAFATETPGGQLRTTLINEDPDHAAAVTLKLAIPRPPYLAGLSAETLSAPSLSATGDVSLAGRSFGVSTRTGRLTGTTTRTELEPVGGSYSITVAPASAVLLTGHSGP